MNLPNLLTLFRMALIPVFVALYYQPAPAWALMIFLLAGMTDFLDGYLARRFNQITAFGKLMDPLADKLMLLTVLYALADTGDIPGWIVWVMLGKEAIMVIGAVLMLRRTVVMSDWSGKVATVAFILAVFAVFPWHSVAWLSAVGNVLLYVALALSLFAMLNYGYTSLFVKKKREGEQTQNS